MFSLDLYEVFLCDDKTQKLIILAIKEVKIE